jgi:hypothetical protein
LYSALYCLLRPGVCRSKLIFRGEDKSVANEFETQFISPSIKKADRILLLIAVGLPLLRYQEAENNPINSLLLLLLLISTITCFFKPP